MAKVTVIPASRTLYQPHLNDHFAIKRVAGYARVSTGHEDQATSYEAQVNYYRKYIQSKPEWQLVDIYTDEGISGTSIKKREGFKRMIQDALDGKIDLILTKSISRFARNTVDTLTHVRMLKEKGVEIWFEKEGIQTFDAKGELLIIIMSSLAQEEARSISENVTWGHRKRFAEGKAIIPYSNILGYKRGPDNTLVIDEQEAAAVRRIYDLFLDGYALPQIGKILQSEGIRTVRGCTRWAKSTLLSILKNEKYCGDLLIQKTVVVNFLTKESKPNDGEAPQYYIRDHHEAIIPPKVWEQVQYEIKTRFKDGRSKSDLLSSRLKCHCCGFWYGKKPQHCKTNYASEVWICNERYKNQCKSLRLKEEQIKEAYLSAVEILRLQLTGQEPIFHIAMESVLDYREDEQRLSTLESEERELKERLTQLSIGSGKVREEILSLQEEQLHFYERWSKVSQEIQTLRQNIADKKQKRSVIQESFSDFMKQRAPMKFTRRLWTSLIEEAEVDEASITFRFKNGMKIRIEI